MTAEVILSILALTEQKNGLPTGLLTAVCAVESNLNPNAFVPKDGISARTSRGLCMVGESALKDISPSTGLSELFKPDVNARIAAIYLHRQIERYHSLAGGIIAYNRGSWSRKGTNQYYRNVMKAWSIYGGSKSITTVIGGGYQSGDKDPAGSHKSI